MAHEFSKGDLTDGRTGDGSLSAYLCTEILAADDAKGDLKDRWDQNEQIFRNDPDIASVQLYDNFEPRTTPVMSPRIRRIVNVMVSTFTAPSVWVQATPDDQDQSGADELEKGVHTVMERSSFVRKLRRCGKTAALDGVSAMRVRMTLDGLKVDYIHPNDFIVAPSFGLDITEKHLVGHRFYIPAWQLFDRAKSGQYGLMEPEDAYKYGGDNPDDEQTGYSAAYDKSNATVDGMDRMNDMVELREVLARLLVDGERRWYRAVVSIDRSKVLMIEPYPYVRPWYFDFRFDDESEKFWPGGSVAQNIKGICLLQNDMFNLLVAGSMGTAVPPTIISGGSLGKKIKTVSMGTIIETPHDVKVQAFPQTFNPGAMPALLEIIDNLIDAETGVSQNSIGQEHLASQTATAAAALEKNTVQNEGAYGDIAADFIEQVYMFVQYLARVNTKAFRDYYGGVLSEKFFAAVGNRVRWQTTGGLTGNAPHVQMAKLGAIREMSSDPGSVFHKGRTEEAIGDALQLSINIDRLKKTEDEKRVEAEQRQQEAQIQMAFAMAQAGDGGVDGGLAGQAGVPVLPGNSFGGQNGLLGRTDGV